MSTVGTQSPPGTPRRKGLSLRALRALRSIVLCGAVLSSAAPALAHDLEKTFVSIRFLRDGAFMVDIQNDTNWLRERMARIPGPFSDRVVIWVDGQELRPASAEFLRGEGISVHRLRGTLPPGAHTLRWYYGLVADPYPLTLRRADGRVHVEEVGGDAWSRTLDVSRQFPAPDFLDRLTPVAIVVVLLVPLALRVMASRRTGERLMRAG